MSQQLSQAAADLLNLAKPFKAIIALAEAVESLDGLDNVEATKRRAIAELDKQIAERQEGVSALDSQAEEAKQRADELVTIIAENKKAAEQEAEDIIAKANAQADAIISSAKENLGELEKKSATLEDECNSLTLKRLELEKQYFEADTALKAKKDEIRALAG